MLDLDLLSRKELVGFPARKNLSRYIGFGESGYVLQADEYYCNFGNGLIILCSDGITDALSDEQIENTLRSESDIKIAGNKLIELAVAAENSDNATIILISSGG